MAGALDWLDPRVEQFVLTGEGEQVRAQVCRHWMAVAFPAVRIGLALLAFSTAWLLGGLWLLLLVGAALLVVVHAVWRLVIQHRDRFVITDRRVFRVHGVLEQVCAGLPLTGLAAVEVERPRLGRWFGYGHLRIVPTAHDRGLTEVRWVPDPDAQVDLIRAAMAEQLDSAGAR